MDSTVGGHQEDGGAGPGEPPTDEIRISAGAPGVDPNAPVCPRCGTEAQGHAYCSSCGLHLAAERELPTRAAFKAAADSAPAKSAVAVKAVQASVDSEPRERNRLKVWVPIIGLVAVAALGVSVVALVANRPKSNAPFQAQIRHLQAHLSAADQQLASEQVTITSIKASSQAGAVSTLTGQMQTVSNQVQKFQVCVPELQQEINGLNINTYNTGGYLTSAYLSNPTIVSSNCNRTLNGS